MRRAGLILAVACATGAMAEPPGLLFHVSFDKLTATADFSRGDPTSTFTANLELRSVEGVKGSGLLQRPGERCSYPIKGNFDTSHGSFAIWLKPLNWDGHDKKFRHPMVATPSPEYTMLLYLYPIGDEAVMNHIRVGPKQQQRLSVCGAPVDMFKQNQWVHVVSTWDEQQVKLYADGKKVAEGIVPAPMPKLDTGTFTLCPIEFWKHPQWSDPNEQTLIDEARVYDHALSDDEVLELYAAEVPGGLQLEPRLTVTLRPEYAARSLHLTVRPAHLDERWRQALAAVKTRLEVTGPDGRACFREDLALPDGGVAREVKLTDWADGEYAATATLTDAGATLTGAAKLVKPPTPWLPAVTDWRADRVLEPWTPLRRDGTKIAYLMGSLDLRTPLPAAIEVGGGPVLAAPVTLDAGAAASWSPPRVVEELPQRVVCRATGTLAGCQLEAETLVEFDGLCRVDLTVTPPAGGVELPSLTVAVPVAAAVARYYRNPVCRDWDGQSWREDRFTPYGWLGNESRGLSWFLESDANQVRDEGQPWLTADREGEAVVVRLHLIAKPVKVTGKLTYTIGFETTPVKPLPAARCDDRFASGPQYQGSNLFVYGWGQQISTLNARLIAHDPAGQRKLVDRWRANGAESLSYTCLQCTANLSEEYQFFGLDWSAPYGATFSGYKRVGDNAPYSMVGVCPNSSFPDFLVWCAQQNLANDWSGGIYTDIDGLDPCDNARHGCGWTDAFGRAGRTWPIYAHRLASRRLYAACHDHHKRYFSHAHSNWYAPFNAFNDGWCPGEQYSSNVIGKPTFYMEGIPDRVWRSEFHSPTTGVPTYLLPQLGRLTGAPGTEQRGPTETCIVAAMTYGIQLWAGGTNKQVVEEVWAAQQAFGMKDVTFVPFWEQTGVVTDSPNVKISAWRKPGRWLVVVANWGDQPVEAPLRLAGPAAGGKLEPAWNAAGLRPSATGGRLTIPAKNGALLLLTGVR